MTKHKKSLKSSKRRNQKIYKMKGCSRRRRRSHLGGSTSFTLAYPSTNVPKVPAPELAYTGKKGGSHNSLHSEYPAAYPSKGPPASGFNFLNPQPMNGGCGGTCPLTHPMTGGGTGCLTNNGIPYPDGLVGSKWTPALSGWPGVDGVSGGRNFLGYNTYRNDVPLQIKSVGAGPPFLGGSRKSHRKNKSKKNKKGGALSNFLGQDLINLGRQVNYGIGSAYNGLIGVRAPTNPLPWKEQLPNTPSLNTFKLV